MVNVGFESQVNNQDENQVKHRVKGPAARLAGLGPFSFVLLSLTFLVPPLLPTSFELLQFLS
jgi:hypothetical protein